MNEIVKAIRREAKQNPHTGRIEAIRMVRSRTGLTFHTAKTMVDEVMAGAAWYRSYR